MSATLVIGRYSETDQAALSTAFSTVQITSMSELPLIGVEQRAGIRAVAYNGHAPFGDAEMALLPALGLIANYGVGYDAIDTKAATPRGIKVTNTPDVLNDDVADLAVALLLAQGRELVQASHTVRSGAWASGTDYGLTRKISGGTAGILGLGRIGREIAYRLAAFKMDIHYYSRSEKQTPGWTYHADPVSLATAVDYLIIALVGGAETEKLVSADVINALGPRGIFINIARGSTVDEAALLDALEQGHIAGAGLDVFLNEPQIDQRFYALQNVVLQPHQGSATAETRAAMGQLQRDNIAAFLAGQPLLTAVN